MKRLPPAGALTRWVVVLGVVALGLTHGPILGYRAYANVDEAYASALASRLLDGHLLYQGAVSQRGPLMYRAYEAFAWVHGWDNVLALRIWAVVLTLAHILLIWQIGRRLLSREAATVACAVAFYALTLGFPREDGVAINGEVLQLPALLGATLLQAGAMLQKAGSRARLRGLFLGGVLFGAAVAIKQSAIVHLVPTLVWLLADARRHRLRTGGARRSFFKDLAAACTGAPLVPALFVAQAAANGTLRDMYYYTVVYNRDVHLRPAPSFPFAWVMPLYIQLLLLSGFFIAVAVLLGYALPSLSRRARAAVKERSPGALLRGFGPRHFLALHLVLALAIASAMYRFFPHYYVQALPFFALSIGGMLERAIQRREAARTALAAFMAFLVAGTGMLCYYTEKVDGRVAHDDTVDALSRVIAATTSPEDRIFVWGFSPWLYGYSGRKPAGRYVFSTYVTGYVPWFPEALDVEEARVVPGSVEALLDDLERERPEIVVDTGAVMMIRPMRTYEPFAAYLHEQFCFDMRLGVMDLYRRKPQDTTECAQKSFPRVTAGVDYMGRFIPTLLPKQVDAETSQRLPEGNFFKPIYFLDGPRPAGVEAATTPRREKDEQDARERGLCVPELGDPDCSRQ
jgi:hypothetical protein